MPFGGRGRGFGFGSGGFGPRDMADMHGFGGRASPEESEYGRIRRRNRTSFGDRHEDERPRNGQTSRDRNVFGEAAEYDEADAPTFGEFDRSGFARQSYGFGVRASSPPMIRDDYGYDRGNTSGRDYKYDDAPWNRERDEPRSKSMRARSSPPPPSFLAPLPLPTKSAFKKPSPKKDNEKKESNMSSNKNAPVAPNVLHRRSMFTQSDRPSTESKKEKYHFKITHDGETRRFAVPSYEELLVVFDAVITNVQRIAKMEPNTGIFWKDEDSSLPLIDMSDLEAALDYARQQAEMMNKLPCVLLEVRDKTKEKEETQATGQTTYGAQKDRAAEELASKVSFGTPCLCDVCNRFLSNENGGRYKCVICADYDLCHECNGKGHHKEHGLLRVFSNATMVKTVNAYGVPVDTPYADSQRSSLLLPLREAFKNPRNLNDIIIDVVDDFGKLLGTHNFKRSETPEKKPEEAPKKEETPVKEESPKTEETVEKKEEEEEARPVVAPHPVQDTPLISNENVLPQEKIYPNLEQEERTNKSIDLISLGSNCSSDDEEREVSVEAKNEAEAIVKSVMEKHGVTRREEAENRFVLVNGDGEEVQPATNQYSREDMMRIGGAEKKAEDVQPIEAQTRADPTKTLLDMLKKTGEDVGKNRREEHEKEQRRIWAEEKEEFRREKQRRELEKTYRKAQEKEAKKARKHQAKAGVETHVDVNLDDQKLFDMLPALLEYSVVRELSHLTRHEDRLSHIKALIHALNMYMSEGQVFPFGMPGSTTRSNPKLVNVAHRLHPRLSSFAKIIRHSRAPQSLDLIQLRMQEMENTYPALIEYGDENSTTIRNARRQLFGTIPPAPNQRQRSESESDHTTPAAAPTTAPYADWYGIAERGVNTLMQGVAQAAEVAHRGIKQYDNDAKKKKEERKPSRSPPKQEEPPLTKAQTTLLSELLDTGMFEDVTRMVKVCRVAKTLEDAVDRMLADD